MATAAQVIKAALQRILVQASEAELEASEYNDAMFALNNMMLAYDADGIALGYTEVTSLSDQVTVPTGALRGVIANLAIEVSPDYDGVITAALADAAKQGLNTMRKIGMSLAASRYPSTLPRGSGNYNNGYDSAFYPCSEDEILRETTGAIGLETGTAEAISG